MNTSLKFAAAAAMIGGALSFAAPASAATINGTCGSLSGPTELGGSFDCTKFDSDLGPLNSMILTITGAITGTITLSNGGADPQTFAGTTQSQFFVGALSGFSLSSPLFTASFGTGPQTIAGGDSTTFGPLAGNATSGPMFNNTSLGAYQEAGGGFFSIDVSTLTGLLITGGGGQAGGSQSTSAEVTASVVYDYGVSTPEPATIAVLGAGVLALGIVRRRRNRG